jgi:hypothetical protein
MYSQKFIFNFNLNFMILSQSERILMENCSLYIYTYEKFYWKFPTKKILISPFIKTLVMWQIIACYKCTPKDYDIIIISINFTT